MGKSRYEMDGYREKVWKPTKADEKLRRYGLLFGKPNLSEQEIVEKKALKAELKVLNMDPGWEA